MTERILLWIADRFICLLNVICDVCGLNDYIEASVALFLGILIVYNFLMIVIWNIPDGFGKAIHFLVFGIKAILLTLAWTYSENYKKPLTEETLAKAYRLLEKRYEEKKSRKQRRKTMKFIETE